MTPQEEIEELAQEIDLLSLPVDPRKIAAKIRSIRFDSPQISEGEVAVSLTLEEAGTLTEPRTHTMREAEVRGRARDKVRTAVRRPQPEGR